MKVIIEQIKDNILPTIVICGILVFLFTGLEYNGKTGIFAVVGNVPSEEVTDTQIHEVPKELEELINAPMPDITSKDKVYKSQTPHVVSAMFTVVKDNVTYDGTEGAQGGFTLTLTGVTAQDGSSVMTEMTIEEFNELEEMPYTCIYDREKDMVLFVQSGVYKLHVTCRLSNGATGRFVLTIPVESFYY